MGLSRLRGIGGPDALAERTVSGSGVPPPGRSIDRSCNSPPQRGTPSRESPHCPGFAAQCPRPDPSSTRGTRRTPSLSLRPACLAPTAAGIHDAHTGAAARGTDGAARLWPGTRTGDPLAAGIGQCAEWRVGGLHRRAGPTGPGAASGLGRAAVSVAAGTIPSHRRRAPRPAAALLAARGTGHAPGGSGVPGEELLPDARAGWLPVDRAAARPPLRDRC
jgi:hypothetical protein